MAIALRRSTSSGSSARRSLYRATDRGQPLMRHAARWLNPRSCNALTAAFRWEGPRSFFDQLPHRVVLKREVGDDPAHPRVLVVDGSSACDLAALHAAVLGFPGAYGVGMTPCRRPSSTNVAPASCSLRIAMICASLKRVFRMVSFRPVAGKPTV